MRKQQGGFTLVELILVIGGGSLLIGLGLTAYTQLAIGQKALQTTQLITMIQAGQRSLSSSGPPQSIVQSRFRADLTDNGKVPKSYLANNGTDGDLIGFGGAGTVTRAFYRPTAVYVGRFRGAIAMTIDAATCGDIYATLYNEQVRMVFRSGGGETSATPTLTEVLGVCSADTQATLNYYYD